MFSDEKKAVMLSEFPFLMHIVGAHNIDDIKDIKVSRWSVAALDVGSNHMSKWVGRKLERVTFVDAHDEVVGVVGQIWPYRKFRWFDLSSWFANRSENESVLQAVRRLEPKHTTIKFVVRMEVVIYFERL